jgi:rhomboid family GlyGly-CTERM serine protease
MEIGMSIPISLHARPRVSSHPWFTLFAAALAVGAWFWQEALDVLVYDRAKILSGEFWRLLTSHWVHFSGSHLFWNLVVLLPAGVWLERRNPVALRWTLVLSPLAIGLALLAFDPALTRYAGISGVASGVLVALAVNGLRTQPTARRWWLAVLVFFAVKVAIEARNGGQPINPELGAQGVRSVPLAHVVGAAVGASAVLLNRRRNKQDLTANER